MSSFFSPQIPLFGEIVLTFLPPASLPVLLVDCYALIRTLVRPADLQLQEPLFLFFLTGTCSPSLYVKSQPFFNLEF